MARHSFQIALTITLWWPVLGLCQTISTADKVDLLLAQTETDRCVILHLNEQYPIAQFNQRLKDKYRAGRARIGSVDDFIDKAATQSHVTKTAYLFRCQNGLEGELAGWLHDIAARLQHAEWSEENLEP